MCLVFFFSSRRRHTRWPRDWSSDVCSSDLSVEINPVLARALRVKGALLDAQSLASSAFASGRFDATDALNRTEALEIGRASCRERVEISGGAVSLKRKAEEKRREGSNDDDE